MKHLKHYLLAVVAAVLFSACGTTRTVPLTGRKQNLMISDQEVLSLSATEYSKYMASAKKSTNATNTAMVQRVGQKLANAVQTYLTNNGYANELSNYAWEFNLVQDNSVNAFCMPGGKIVVYEGLLPITQNEASLAVVLGHEIAHAVANHSAEQMSKQIKQQYGLQIGSAVAGALGMGQNTQSIAQVVAQYGLQFRNLKYSRDHETEADRMGLIFAAMAGYDPNVAVAFWQRMAASSGGGTAEFLSDHPSDETRINNIQSKFLPEALRYYNGGTTTNNSAAKASSTKTIKISSKK
ncbi:MAG: M48 family metallopeptidase [Prevotella sp.]|nr:M48 family metallopeptidase [Prevotella sp.]MBR6446761.1 M48 family metallopeptidase [Prevotella sp.]MBR6494212.1 M48 family metallopeptidase [Prevotella sp.]